VKYVIKKLNIMREDEINDRLKKIKYQIDELVNDYCNLKYNSSQFKPMETLIPPSGKLIGVEETRNIIHSALDGWLTSGRFNDKFENKLCEFLNVNFCITVNSGSSANLVAFNTLTSPKLGDKSIKKGDEVITVAAGFPTTINPIIQYGAIPVFVDVDLETHNINHELIENAISDKTKAIVLAHALGNPFNLKKVKEICDKYNLWLIEDTCDALGAEYEGKKVGTFGDLGTLSFYPAHHITMGEGGAVFTNNPELKKIAESYRDWGRDCYCPPGCDNTCGCRFEQKHGDLPFGYDHKYVYSHLGYNLKITDMQAACGLAQLLKVEEFISKRRENFNFLYSKFNSLKDFFHLPKATENSNPSWFGFPLILKNSSGVDRLALIRYLEENKIGTRLLFAGNITKQPYFKGFNYRVSGNLNNTDIIMNNTLWIGVQPSLTKEMLSYVHFKFEEFFGLNF